MATSAATVDEYIAGFPEGTQEVLQELRRRVHAALPDAQERISYQIPTFAVDGRAVVHVAGWARHVSLYPLPDGVGVLDADLAPYRSGRATFKLPLDREIPWDLVDRAIAAVALSSRAEIRGGGGPSPTP